ncbi:MAG: RpiB/LacA/LacB family sugar-phosphate isomerase, partial [Alphaproteobacteria bacterium]|nr:RpiB/LacA/LacB family sugar-phosphate isomerase [Alphaproteobacteria bacterium]
ANVLCLGGRTTSFDTAKKLVDIFLTTPFDGGRHEKRVLELGEMK